MKYVKIELPDYFKRGYCESCPFSYEEFYDYEDDWDYEKICCLGFDDECLLNIEEDKK